jgi:uncharacterized protein (DUF1501 family)
MKCRHSLSRRALLGTSLGGLGLLWLDPELAYAERLPGRRVLVCVFQRGALDGLSAVVPYADDHYYRERTQIAIPRPGTGDGAALKLDDQFGLHPSLGPLLPAYRAKELAFVHAVGPTTATRSHFDAQDNMESGGGELTSHADGWLNRCLALQTSPTLQRAVAISGQLPRALSGPENTLALRNLQSFDVRVRTGIRHELRAGFEELYRAGDDRASKGGRQALEVTRTIQSLDPKGYKPEHGARYAKGWNALRDAAQLIKAEIGVELVWLDVGGWDTHTAQAGPKGRLPRALAPMAESLAAFRADLGAHFAHVTVLTMSEFGRTVAQNGSGGTDHGHGTAMMVLGGAVNGGRVVTRWPGLSPEQRFEGRDLAVTTDFRDLFAEVAAHQFGVTSFENIFPDHAPEFVGVMRT